MLYYICILSVAHYIYIYIYQYESLLTYRYITISTTNSEFIQTLLPQFQSSNPTVQCKLIPNNVLTKHPYLTAEWLNGKQSTISIKNQSSTDILQSCNRLRNSTGRTLSTLHQWSTQSTGRRSLQGRWNYLTNYIEPQLQLQHHVKQLQKQGVALYDDVLQEPQAK